MRFRVIVSLALVVGACAHPGGTGAPADAERLVGTWRLVEVVAVRNDGTKTTSRWGPNPRGYIVYDRSGHMAAQIMGDPRPTFRDADRPTPEEGLAAFDSYLAYAGTYVYDQARHVVTHHVEMSADPSDVGQDLPREAQLDGDRVILLAEPYSLKGEQVRNRLTWARVSGP